MNNHAQLTARDIHCPYMQLLTNLQGDNGPEWLEALKRFNRKENPWEKTMLLRRLGTTTVLTRTTTFVARDYFKVAKDKKNKVKISFVGDNFANWFLIGEGKVEVASTTHELAHHELVKRSLDVPIVDELGGEAPAESTLCDIWSQLEAQGSGETGDLLTSGYANIFYVRDAAGVLRVVYVYWYGGGWFVVCASGF